MRLAFYISGTSGRLRKFLFQASQDVKGKIVLVISDKPIEGTLDALLSAEGIKHVCFEYGSIQKPTRKEKDVVFSDKLLEYFTENKVDYCFCCGDHIMRGELLHAYANRIINFHPSLLPMYRGPHPIDRAAAEKEAMIVGNTAHFIDESIDGGPIIMQAAIPIKAFTDSGGDYDSVMDLQVTLMQKIFPLLEAGRIYVNGKEAVIDGADYTVSAVFPKV